MGAYLDRRNARLYPEQTAQYQQAEAERKQRSAEAAQGSDELASIKRASAEVKKPQNPTDAALLNPNIPLSALQAAQRVDDVKAGRDAPTVMGQYGSKTVYRNDMTNPKDQAEYGKAIFSDSYRGATKRGFDADYKAAGLKNNPYGVATAKPDFHNGVDIRGMSPQAQQQFVGADRQHLAEQRNYLGALRRYQHLSETERQGVQRPVAPLMPNAVADARGQPRAGETTPHAEQAQNAQTAYEREMAKARLGPDAENRRTGALADAANREFSAKQAGIAPFIRPPLPEIPKDLDPETANQFAMARLQQEKDANTAEAAFAEWFMQQVKAGNPTPDVAEFYRSNPMYLRYASPETQNAVVKPRQYAAGGLVSPQPQPAELATSRYRDYAVRAQRMGLPVVPFDQFSQMQSSQGVRGYANGGRVVVDPDPNAPQDSIPAVIDGERPARLDSGEFIFPADVAAFYGTQRLSKMIDQARNGAMQGDKPQGAMAGAR